MAPVQKHERLSRDAEKLRQANHTVPDIGRDRLNRLERQAETAFRIHEWLRSRPSATKPNIVKMVVLRDGADRFSILALDSAKVEEAFAVARALAKGTGRTVTVSDADGNVRGLFEDLSRQ